MFALDEQLSHMNYYLYVVYRCFFIGYGLLLEAGCSCVQNLGNIHTISTSECMIQKVQFKMKDKLHCGITLCKWLALHVWKPQMLRDCHIF